jgi:hypothetical protein
VATNIKIIAFIIFIATIILLNSIFTTTKMAAMISGKNPNPIATSE